ncbi:hypothetical protein GCM10011316_22010 [Roseibium aquae]|uniref:Diguanylate cyclase (GGDEF)-like protein n=1 Tax=Roseibium aquae TaxID=1323746 RepID=A0A916X130_9HYPH|nr:bifunctional diguanylate cyclase/phosphodiesterase [Roseibium aquae]GGB49487.1 hypothetical protein GCM10011316_22010 [Roseibium aquae]
MLSFTTLLTRPIKALGLVLLLGAAGLFLGRAYIYDAADIAIEKVDDQEALLMIADVRRELAAFQLSVTRFFATPGSADHIADVQHAFQQFIACTSAVEMLLTNGSSTVVHAAGTEVARVLQEVKALRHPIVHLEAPHSKRRLASAMERIDAQDMTLAIAMDTALVESRNQTRAVLMREADIQMGLALGIAGIAAAFFLMTGYQSAAMSRIRRKAAEHSDKAAFAADHDRLTGLPNRDAFMRNISDALEAVDDAERFALVALKIDGIKQINEQYGFQVGDSTLECVAERLSMSLKALDSRNMLARTGNTTFMALLRGGGSASELSKTAALLLEVIKAPQKNAYMSARLSGSAGLALAPKGGISDRDLALNAELALHEARLKESGSLVQFTPDLRAGLRRRRRIEEDLKTAIRNADIYPVYQPQFDMKSGKMVGMEALARWKHPELGMIPPLEFITAAESAGGIVDIGRHILRTACQDAASMRGRPTVSVNLSVLQVLNDDVPRFTREVLDETGLQPDRLKLEVTESVIIGDTKRVRQTLEQIKAMGVAISLDDFGTGYSALSYLTEFDWDELKIDRSFVAKAIANDRARSIVETVRSLANTMDARLTVEGIETADQRDVFAALGYQVAQGYFYSKPMSFEDLNASPFVLTSRSLEEPLEPSLH